MAYPTRNPAPPRRHYAAPRHRPPRRGPLPEYRPSWLLRALVGMAAIGAVLFTIALMWSDQAPSVLKPVLTEGLRELWYRVDPDRVAGDVNRADLPRTDFMLHVGVWATVSTLVFITVWTWRGLVLSGVLITGLSYAIEIGQGRFSTTRHVDFADVIANTIGIALGAMVAVVLFVAYDTVARFLAAIFGGGGRR